MPKQELRNAAQKQRIDDFYERCFAAAYELLDAERHLIALPASDDPTIKTYWQAGSLPLAHALLNKDDVDAQAEGAAIVAAVLESQETAPHHPHRGNWKWLADDPEVGDLNAIQFVLRWLLPLLVQHNDKLPADLQALCRDRVRLALEEEVRLDVQPTFTNIHIGSLFALLVGGEWLDNDEFLLSGKARWNRWLRFTVVNGAPHEYNSPDYGGWQLSALASIHQYVQDPIIQLQAKLMYERLALHLLLHLHRATGQIAGPHSRSYWQTMTSGRGMTKDVLWLLTGWDWLLATGAYGGDAEAPVNFMNLGLALVEQTLPTYLTEWLDNQQGALPYEVCETANLDEGFDLTTYFTRSYALGTASKTYTIGTDCFYIEHEANYLMLHYTCPPEKGGWGLMYSRYVVNDRHWGTMGPAPDRPKTGNFYDHGHFAGVQQRNKAIGVYALMPEQEEVFSLKTIVAFQSGTALEEVWINDSVVDLSEVQHTLQASDWLIVADGDVYVGVRALEPSVLSQSAPIQLEKGPQGELWLAIYNYQGAAIRFWDYASLKGAFWRGNLRAGFVVEVAERSEYDSAAAFLAYLQMAQIADGVDDNYVRTVTYTNGGDSLSLRYDLWHTCPAGRLLAGKVYVPPQLTSPLAVQGQSGYLQVGQAHLYTQPQPMWLAAQALDESDQTYVAVNPVEQVTSLKLETPAGTVSAGAWGLGRLEWRVAEGILRVDCLQMPQDLVVPDGVHIEISD